MKAIEEIRNPGSSAPRYPGKVPESLTAPTTVIVESALSTPANGPESNPTDSESGRAGKADGTRTEAEQKVPQAKPERAVASVRPAAAQCNRRAGTGIANGACQRAAITRDDQQTVAGKKLRRNGQLVAGVHRPTPSVPVLNSRTPIGSIVAVPPVSTLYQRAARLAAHVGEHEVPARSALPIFERTSNGPQAVFPDRNCGFCVLAGKADRRAVAADERRGDLDGGWKTVAPRGGQTEDQVISGPAWVVSQDLFRCES